MLTLKNAHNFILRDKPWAFIGISIFLICSTLYYYIRFQFDLVYFVPILQYAIAYLMIGAMILCTVLFRRSFLYNKMDLLLFVFLINNAVFIPLSFYRYGMTEGLYAIKNYLTTLLLYFVVVVFLDAKRAKMAVHLIAVLCVIVSTVYVAEMASIRYAPINIISSYMNSQGPFNYSVLLDQYALEKAPEGHGVSKSWRKSETSMYIRMPGPLGHSSATAFIIAVGTILCYSMIIFGQGRWKKYSIVLFLLCLTGLIWGCSRTNMAGGLAGIALVTISGIALKYVSIQRTMIIITMAVVFIATLMLLSVIDLSTYRQVFSPSQTMETLYYIFPAEALARCFNILTSNPICFLFGYGLPPILSSTYVSSKYTGVPFASDDSFYIQILSQYGVIGNVLYIIAAIFIFYDSYKNFISGNREYIKDNIFAIIGIIAVIVATLTSIVHAASTIRPQVSPVIFILLASYSVISRNSEN